MLRKSLLRRSLLILLFCASPALADAGLDAVRALGRLNGEALACKQMALVDRIRIGVIREAPKTREVGEVFEAATSERFLAMGSDKSACTDGRTLAGQVDAGLQTLRAAFAEAMGRK